jgi:hypothetical protein
VTARCGVCVRRVRLPGRKRACGFLAEEVERVMTGEGGVGVTPLQLAQTEVRRRGGETPIPPPCGWRYGSFGVALRPLRRWIW